jgi:hypothetical protein
MSAGPVACQNRCVHDLLLLLIGVAAGVAGPLGGVVALVSFRALLIFIQPFLVKQLAITAIHGKHPALMLLGTVMISDV